MVLRKRENRLKRFELGILSWFELNRIKDLELN